MAGARTKPELDIISHITAPQHYNLENLDANVCAFLLFSICLLHFLLSVR